MSTTSVCTNAGQVNCSDPFSVIIFALLNLGNPSGSSLEDILISISEICPSVDYSDSELQGYINDALKQGLLVTGTSALTYSINAAMNRVNPKNKPYYCIGLYYKC